MTTPKRVTREQLQAALKQQQRKRKPHSDERPLGVRSGAEASPQGLSMTVRCSGCQRESPQWVFPLEVLRIDEAMDAQLDGWRLQGRDWFGPCCHLPGVSNG